MNLYPHRIQGTPAAFSMGTIATRSNHRRTTMIRLQTLSKHSYSLLAVAVVGAALGAVALPAAADDGAGAAFFGGPGMRGHMMMGGSGPMMGNRGGPGANGGGRMVEGMLDLVNASADQRSRIKAIMDAAHNDLRTQQPSTQGQRDQMRNLFAQPNIDARAAEALRAQMAVQRDAASKRMLQARLDAAAVLTPEQRKLLAERMAQGRSMMERHRAERQSLERR
jgi:Spy/CpxP family protein refolding chaperone